MRASRETTCVCAVFFSECMVHLSLCALVLRGPSTMPVFYVIWGCAAGSRRTSEIAFGKKTASRLEIRRLVVLSFYLNWFACSLLGRLPRRHQSRSTWRPVQHLAYSGILPQGFQGSVSCNKAGPPSLRLQQGLSPGPFACCTGCAGHG